MTKINRPAAPGEGIAGLPTPEVTDTTPSQPGEGSAGLPTPEVDASTPVQPGEGSVVLPTPTLPGQTYPSNRSCPRGYHRRVVENNQTYTDLLLENNVSFNAMRSANPNLPITRLSPGTVYCTPPSGSRRVCVYGSSSYVIEQGETIYTLAQTLGISPGRLLQANPSLAPGDFLPGRVICLP